MLTSSGLSFVLARDCYYSSMVIWKTSSKFSCLMICSILLRYLPSFRDLFYGLMLVPSVNSSSNRNLTHLTAKKSNLLSESFGNVCNCRYGQCQLCTILHPRSARMPSDALKIMPELPHRSPNSLRLITKLLCSQGQGDNRCLLCLRDAAHQFLCLTAAHRRKPQ